MSRYSGSDESELWEGTSCSALCSWTQKQFIPVKPYISVVPLTSGKLAVIYSKADDLSCCSVLFYSGSAWSSAGYTPWNSTGTYMLYLSGCTSIGDTVETAGCASSGSGEYYLTVAYTTGTPSWSSATRLDTLTCGQVSGTQIVSDGSSRLVFYTADSSTNVVKYFTSSDSGRSWSSATTISSSEPTPRDLSASPL